MFIKHRYHIININYKEKGTENVEPVVDTRRVCVVDFRCYRLETWIQGSGLDWCSPISPWLLKTIFKETRSQGLKEWGRFLGPKGVWGSLTKGITAIKPCE